MPLNKNCDKIYSFYSLQALLDLQNRRINSDIMKHSRIRFFLDLHADGELAMAPGSDIVPAERLTTHHLYFRRV